MEPFKHLQAIVLDWAGTMVDHGSCAPAVVFQEVFAQKGVPISIAEAREPMGKAKREHIASVAAIPRVAEAWKAKHGTPCTSEDVDALYETFLPLQRETLGDHCQLIDGAAEAANAMRSRGLKIGSSTGYTHELMKVVSPAAKEQGYEPDIVLCAEDAVRGRPAPYLLFKAAELLEVYPMHHFVKVDDTAVGIEAGRNAGCWTVGITRTGNCVGLSKSDFDALDAEQQQSRIHQAASTLLQAGAHMLVDTVADILPILDMFDDALERGEIPATTSQLMASSN